MCLSQSELEREEKNRGRESGERRELPCFNNENNMIFKFDNIYGNENEIEIQIKFKFYKTIRALNNQSVNTVTIIIKAFPILQRLVQQKI